CVFFFSSRRRHTRFSRDWSSDVCSSDLESASRIRAITEDPQGRVWFAAGRELHRIASNGRHSRLPILSPADGGLPDAAITGLMVDRAGLLWLSSAGRGLYTARSHGDAFSFITDADATAPGANSVLSLAAADDNSLWLGTDGLGLRRYHFADDRFEPGLAEAVTGSATLPASPSITGIAGTPDGQLWLASNAGLVERLADGRYRLHALDATGPLALTSIAAAEDGTLWLGSSDAGLLRFDPGAGKVTQRWRSEMDSLASLSSDRINALHLDSQQRLWVGTEDGLNLLLPDSSDVRQLRHDTADSDSLGGDVVLSISETRDGSLWIGTQQGLDRLRMAPGAERPTIERTKQPSQPVVNGVLAALEDHGGRLWLSTDDGLVRLNRDGNGSHRYRIGEGLQGLDFHPGSALELDDGRLLFGGANGINLLPAD